MEGVFIPRYDESELSREFKLLSEPDYAPAKRLVEKFALDFDDLDGNFIEQFQTTAFGPRLWELYLNAFFRERCLSISSDKSVPDFILSHGGCEFCVEAVSTNDSQKGVLFEAAVNGDDVKRKVDFQTLKISQALRSKLDKNYSRYDHVDKSPFVLALTCMHDEKDVFASFIPVLQYLYKRLFDFEVYPQKVDGKGALLIKRLSYVSSIRFDNKVVPMGFWDLPGAEVVSAVLFRAGVTCDDLNRIGRQRWPELGCGMKRFCALLDISRVWGNFKIDSYVVGDRDESLDEGMMVFHNPNARHPLSFDVFAGLPQLFIGDHGLDGEHMEDFLHSSTVQYLPPTP